MGTIQVNKSTSVNLIESVYGIIKSKSGQVTVKHLEREIGSKAEVRYAITRLTLQGKIKRIKGFGKDRIEYFYRDIAV
jgi:hypothetical protein